MRESEVKLSDDRQMLGVHSVCEAVAVAIEYGIISDDQILGKLLTKDYPIG
ncbi:MULTISPECIES: hypothetical protein [Mahella]|jgi:hypothetical protein|uniref:Uncharacterized protein n=1 Tax=Mahella australiensis (strain DSM 15567 / CIP 107919 / 50-1 BON) TaxID=697281 RepID=F3ZZ33_MAHA5|nr:MULTISPECIES: hypothetical protein [Mahella]AEE96792.1 hypothetical protein Mahau_1604 [Mahella australiensis 50-1 BON]AEE96802.1 hypothetical protein Mahau_1616 [Mahella australiensis 50-1 BON]MBZ4666457.1 hypothetical protein [Mahella sp.]